MGYKDWRWAMVKTESESGDLEIESDPSPARSMQQRLGVRAFGRQSRRAPSAAPCGLTID